MEMNNKAVVIFADVQQDIKSVSCVDAQVFVADACNKARKIISERMSEVEK